MTRFLLTWAFLGMATTCFVGAMPRDLSAQEIRVPDSLVAGETTTISTAGSGKASFYLIGPGASRKSDVSLGEDIRIEGGELRVAGEYLALLCAETCHGSEFLRNRHEARQPDVSGASLARSGCSKGRSERCGTGL